MKELVMRELRSEYRRRVNGYQRTNKIATLGELAAAHQKRRK